MGSQGVSADNKPWSQRGVKHINGGMPNRISMNVTVPKQTQGATFGEMVNPGLRAAVSALSQGYSISERSNLIALAKSSRDAVASESSRGHTKTGHVTLMK